MKKKHTLRKIILCFLIALIIAIPVYIAISRYINSLPKLQYTYNDLSSGNRLVEYPDSQFAVISDLHYYDSSLGTKGKAFEEYLNSDRKLLRDSADLLDLAVNEINNLNVKFVLVPGDLTKDGELVCHQRVKAALSRLSASGKKVYVIPGNHDINNTEAFQYKGELSLPVPNITPGDFSTIYGDFGYNTAIERDSGTLSYVAEPVDGLWLVALDTSRYKENKSGYRPIVSSKMSQKQEKWLESILSRANKLGKAVIVMSHHGIVEHWKGQGRLHKDYLIQDYKHISRLLASYNVRLAFTGHYHAQDITLEDFDENGYIYDIETGSLITAPCSVRYCTLKNNKIYIDSEFLAGKLHPGTDFEKKAFRFVSDSVKNETVQILRKYFVPKKDANYIGDYIARGFMAHYSGDEKISLRPAFDSHKVNLWSRFVFYQEKYVSIGLWNDLTPSDNSVTLDLGEKIK